MDVFRHWMWWLNHMHSLKLTHGTFTWANFATCKLHLDEAAKKRIHPKCVCGQGGLGQRVQTNCAFSARRPQLPLGSQRVVSHPPGLWVSAIFGHLYHLHPTTLLLHSLLNRFTSRHLQCHCLVQAATVSPEGLSSPSNDVPALTSQCVVP